MEVPIQLHHVVAASPAARRGKAAMSSRTELSPLELPGSGSSLSKRRPGLSSESIDSLRRRNPDKIIQLSPRRIGMRVRDALRIHPRRRRLKMQNGRLRGAAVRKVLWQCSPLLFRFACRHKPVDHTRQSHDHPPVRRRRSSQHLVSAPRLAARGSRCDDHIVATRM